MAATNRFLQNLIDDSADAMTNMYDVFITFPGSDNGEQQTMMTVRAEGFEIPEPSVETYDVKYKGNTYTKVKSSMTFERKFSLVLRVDAAYNIVETFNKWLSYVANPATGGVANYAAAKGTVTVNAIGTPFTAYGDANTTDTSSIFGNSNMSNQGEFLSSGQYIKSWVFEDVWTAKVGQPKFNTENTDLQKVTVEFYFGQTPSFPGFTS